MQVKRNDGSSREILSIQKGKVRASNVMSSEQFTFRINDIDFFIPIKNAMKKSGLKINDFKTNNEGLLLYSWKDTEANINNIAEKCGISANEIVFPTKDQSEKICQNAKYQKTLINADIWWTSFIIDKNNEKRNVSLKEYLENQDKYRFCVRSVETGKIFDCDPAVGYAGAVILGTIK